MNRQYQTVRATTTEKLQKKVNDFIKRGWKPEGDIHADYKTKEVKQTNTKEKDK